MATFEISARRLVLAGGFAIAVAAAPAIAAFTTPSVSPANVAACPTGEEEDTFTGVCLPHTVPNSPVFTTPLGNPDIPEIDGIPCTGRNSGECIGLQENAPKYVPPTSSVGSSPTVHGTA